MKKFFVFIVFILINTLPVSATTLDAGVSVNEVPKEFFGSWRINGYLDKTNSPKTFKPQGADYWNLYRTGEVLTLENPVTGADAQVLINCIEGNLIIFTRKSEYDGNKKLTDKISIRVNGDKFDGYNELILETRSIIDNHLLKTETAIYKINGYKIANTNNESY